MRLYQMQTVVSALCLADTARETFAPRNAILSHPVLRRSTFDILNEMEVSAPMPPFYVEPLESMPARWDFTPGNHGEKGKLAARWDAAIRAQEQEFCNILVLTEVPDTTPIFVGKLIDGIGAWSNPRDGSFLRELRDVKTVAAIKSMEPEALLNNTAAGFANPWTAYPVTVYWLMTEIRRHMLEVNDGEEAWDLWTPLEVMHYLRERLGRFLVETGIVQDVVSLGKVSAGVASYDLPTTTAEIKRVVYDDVGLYPMDFWQVDHSNSWSEASGTPYGYMENVEQLSLQLVPPPDASGAYLKAHTVRSTPFTEPNGGAETLMEYYLRVPAIFSWAIKYGVMADMLKKEGEANDPKRAEWCEQRFKDGVEIAKMLVGLPTSGGQQ